MQHTRSRLRPVDRRTATEQAHEILRAWILDGSAPAGSRLIEPELAAELGISRTPVREALQRLEQEGLVEKASDFGRRVTRFSRDQVTEIIGIRSVLEGYAARLAAERITDPELSLVREAHEEARGVLAEGDVRRLVELNTQFHDRITASSHAPRVVSMIGQLRDWVLRYRVKVLEDEFGRRRSFDQHAEILSALQRRDAKVAEELVRGHIAGIVDTLLRAGVFDQ